MTSGAGTSCSGPTFLATWRTQPRQIAFLLARAQVVRVADHAALGAAQRDVDDGALPGHPHRQGADRVDRLLRVEADAALAGAAGVVVLDAEAAEDLHLAVVHPDRDGEVVFAQRDAQQVAGRLVEAEDVGGLVELCWAISKGLNELFMWFSLSSPSVFCCVCGIGGPPRRGTSQA